MKTHYQIFIIFVALVLLSSVPNLGLSNEFVCMGSACPVVRLQNPLILPYSWIFPEKKCSYCTLAGSVSALLYVNSFPLVHLMNLTIDVAYLLLLSVFISFGVNKIPALKHMRIKKRKKKRKRTRKYIPFK